MASSNRYPLPPKREHDRQRVTLRALTQSGAFAPEQLGVVTDLSPAGAFIETHTKPSRGSVLWVSLIPPGDSSPIHAYVEVVRTTARGIGTRFVRLDPDAPYRLRRLTGAPVY
jgi:hypothetical protein